MLSTLLQKLAGAGLEAVADGVDGVQRTLGDLVRVTRFLQGLAELESRADDVYVASYPRSGTTWMQLICHLLLSGERELNFAHISHVAPWFERNLSLGHSRAVDFDRLPSPRVFKTHLPRLWLPRAGRMIYLERDVRDVAVSYFHLYRSHLGFRGDFDQFFERFVRGELQYRSWFKHVEGWRRLAGEREVLLLRYEQMRAAPEAAIGRVADFLGVSVGEPRLAEIAQLSSIEQMRSNQDRFDHATEHLAGRGQFIREGNVGQGDDYLSPAQHERLEQNRPPYLPHLEFDLRPFLH